MKNASRLVVAVVLLSSGSALGTPSTTFWTPATTYVQPYLVPHVTYDTYFRDNSTYPIDTGLTMGILPFEKVQAEIGFDFFMPAPNASTGSALQLNGKIGVPEGAFAAWQPGISGGIYGLGFKDRLSNYNLLHAEISKTLPVIGTLIGGAYYSLNQDIMLSNLATGARGDRAGGMGAYVTPDINISGVPGLNKVNFFADFMTGSNSYGAVGGGVGIFFTPAIDILTGPVFFLESAAQPNASSWMWSIQLDVDIELFRKPAAPPPAPAPAPRT